MKKALLILFSVITFSVTYSQCNVTLLSGSSNICAGSSVTLGVSHNFTSSVTYNWSNNSLSSEITITPPQSQSFSCTISDGTASCTTIDFPITVIPVPVIQNPTSGARCDAGIVNLSASASAGNVNWYSSPTGGTSLNSGNTFSPSISATTIFYVDATNNGCTSPRTAVTATINQTPSITLQSQTICSSNSFTLTPANGAGNIVPNGTTYSWSAPSVSGITGTASGSLAASIAGSLTNTTNSAINVSYTVTPTSGSCIGSTFATTITVNPKPNVNSQTATICSSAPFSITPTNGTGNIVPTGTTYSWSAPTVSGITGTASGSSAATISGSLTNTTNSAIDVSYTVTPTSGSCIGTSFAATITVNPKPNVNPQTATICSAGSFSLTPMNGTGNIVPTGTTYSWSAPSVSGITGTASGSLAASIAGSLTNTTNSAINVSYTVTPTSGSCIGSSFAATITVDPKPNVNSQTATICSAGLFSITPTNGTGNIIPSGTTYSWSAPTVSGISGTAPGSSTASITGSLTNTTNSAINVSYTVTPTSGSCIGSSFATTITVNPKPNVNSQTATICSAGSFSLTPTNGTGNIVPIGTTYSWSAPSISGITGTASGSLAASITGTLTNTTNSAINVSYTVTPTSGSCIGNSFNTTINVKPVPAITSNTQEVCSNSEFQGIWVSPNIVPLNTNYTWSVTNNTQVIGETNNNVASVFSQSLTNLSLLNQTVVYTLTPSADACVGSPFTLNLEVKPSPTANAGQDFTKTCVDNINGSSIGSSSVTGFSYSWSPSNGLNFTNISNPNANPSTSTTYTLTVTDQLSNCSAADQVVVSVNNTAPTANAGADGNITCVSNSNGITIGASPIIGYSYSWSPITGLASSNSSSTVANPNTSQPYTLTVTNNTNGCISTDQVIVSVNKTNPIANAGLDFIKTCTTNNNGLQIGTVAISGNTYSWMPALGLSNSSVANPTANPSVTTIYTLVVTNSANGCSASDQITVDVNQQQPLVSAGSDFTKTCIANTFGANIGMSPQPNTSYSWSPSTSLTSGSLSNPFANPSSTTTYTLTATSLENGCTANDQVVVTVNQNYPVSNAGSDFTKTCVSNLNGNTIGMNAISGITYSWLPSTGLSSNNIANPIANPSQTTLFTLTSTDPTNGCTSSDQVLVTVNNSAPTAYAGLDATITCNQNTNGAVIGMPPVIGITYSWTPNNGLSSSNQSEVIANPNGNTTYTLTATNTANGCVSSDAVSVNLDTTPPIVNAGNDIVICQGEQILLNGTSNGAQINWTPSFLVQNPNQLSTEGNISGTTTFTLTATGNNGCIAQDYVTAQFSIVPSSGLNTSFEICQNGTLDLIVNSGVTCSWSGIYTGVGNSVSIGGLESGLLNLNLTNNDGCAASETISVVVNPIPYPIITGAQAVCQNSYWEKYSVPSTSNELAWSVTNGELMSFSNANDAVVHWGTGNLGTIHVTETVSQTGCSNNYSYEVLLDNSLALDTAEVLQLSSNVLYTPQDYAFMNWGYQSIQTNIPVSVGVYSQYCNFPNFDPSQNYYWVEIGDGNGCVTKSYFNNPIFTADLEHITSQHIQVFPNPTSGFLIIETDFSEFYFEVISLEGQVLKSGKGSFTINLNDLDYSSGIYYLNISSNGKTFKHKIIKL